MKSIAKKILAYSLGYSFNRNKRTAFATNAKSYQDEFKKDETATYQRKPEWIDTDLKDVDLSGTKFYNFKHGVKKRFLNRIRNKYFFATQMYYLLGDNYNKQLKCIQDSFVDFGQAGIKGDTPPPTPTPIFIQGGGNPTPTPVSTQSAGSINTAPTRTGNNADSSLKLSSAQTATNSESTNNASGSTPFNASKNNPSIIQLTKEEEKKTQLLGGVAQGGSSGSSSIDNKGLNSDFNFPGIDGENSHTSGGVGFKDEEKAKINATLNSNQEPQFSQEDSIFNQITVRYVKNYRNIFRTERRGSAQ